jgi:hypothetical protein
MPTQIRWRPPVPLSPAEEAVAQHLHRNGKFYVFLREIRAELFDEAFQAELAAAYAPRGTAPLPAALLAMVTLLQAYDQVSDVEAVTTAQMDRRWQLVLDCLGCARAPFSQGALVTFRARMIAHDLDRKLLDRTVALAKQTGRFGWQHLRAALDSSPLVGAGRVQDTWNLLGRALGTVATCAAKAVGRPRAEVLRAAQVTLLGAPSLKAALDIDWDDPAAQAAALARLLAEVDQLEQWVEHHVPAGAQPAPLQAALAALRRVLTQDLEPDPVTQGHRIRRGVAADRMPSLGDPEMRHGRKTRTRPFNGYKRHLLKVLGANVIVGALVRPANEAEHLALAPLLPTVTALGALEELLIDRGYLASAAIADLHAAGTAIRAKAWTSHNGGRYPKPAFTIDLAAQQVTCPTAHSVAIRAGVGHVHFPGPVCDACADRAACTTAPAGRGRSLTLHPQEALLLPLRAAMRTPDGRAVLRDRTSIEHSLARLGQLQGGKARYKGVRKNTLDVRRCAAVANLEQLRRLKTAA